VSAVLRRRVGSLVAVLSAALATGVLALVLSAGGATHRAAPSSTGARRIGALSHGTIRFALDLRLHEHALDAFLRRVEPGAAGGLSATGFGARFGLSNARLAGLRGALGRLGISVDRTYPQRTAMLVHGSVGEVQRLFAMRFARYATSDGKRYFAPEGPPRIPRALAPYISGLGDLSDHPVESDDIPSEGLTPKSTAKAYDITPLWNAGFRGQGETIAIVTASGAVNPADLQAFAKRVGVSEPQIEIKQVDGGSTYHAADGSDGEVDLDFQTVLGLVPEAHIIDYQGAYGSSNANDSIGHSLADLYNQVEQDGKAKVVTTSYGECEAAVQGLGPGDQQLIDNSLKALEASNVTVFESTGDTGAYACLQAAQIEPDSHLGSQYTGLSVQTPGSSPYAVAVGGTRLELRRDGSYLTESAWSDPLERGGGGGGVSSTEKRPSWQQGPGTNQPHYNPKNLREIPDVSGPADPNSGFLNCDTLAGDTKPTCEAGNGGTSAAAPFWAASMLLVQQYAAAHGAGSLAHCFAGPILYDLAAKHQPVPAFHAITRGNNGYYPATPGWNFATGLGSPDVFNLAQDYTSFLRSQSSNRCPF
jgi:subtilase family serine protease